MFTVEATDPDEGTNAIIDFSLGTTGVQDVFIIVETDGSIFVRPNANIDFEQTQSYTVKLIMCSYIMHCIECDCPAADNHS